MKIANKAYFYLFGILLILAFSVIVSAAPNMQEGSWEISMEIKMEGLPFQMPPMTFKDTQCLTKEDIVPKTAKKGENCEVIDQKITGNKVTWKVKCVEKDATTVGEGEITYSRISYNGILHTKTTDKTGQTMASTSKLTGRRLGDCKK